MNFDANSHSNKMMNLNDFDPIKQMRQKKFTLFQPFTKGNNLKVCEPLGLTANLITTSNSVPNSSINSET